MTTSHRTPEVAHDGLRSVFARIAGALLFIAGTCGVFRFSFSPTHGLLEVLELFGGMVCLVLGILLLTVLPFMPGELRNLFRK